jgi:hypothetical protein
MLSIVERERRQTEANTAEVEAEVRATIARDAKLQATYQLMLLSGRTAQGR